MSFCLTMIVKDEAHTVTKCFDSMLPFIDTWAICDTGSVDGTQKIIQKYFDEKQIPGELQERPWVNFGHNRTEAFQLAKGKADFIWIMDADETIVGDPALDSVSHDAYLLRVGAPTEFTWWNPRIFRSGLDWRYVGVVHEYAEAPDAKSAAQLPGDYFITAAHGGARSRDPEKYHKDALAIERALADDPTNTRYAFYLGQSWFNAGEFTRAKAAYERRIQLGGWVEETFYSMYRIGACYAALGNREAMLGQMLLTFDRFPHRAEPIYFAAKNAMEARQFRLGYELASVGAKIETPPDLLFVEADVYTWRMLDVLAVCGYWTDRRREARALNERLLHLAPPTEHPRISANLAFCKS